MNGTYWQMTIITVGWILTLIEAYVFFGIIRPLAPNIHESLTSAILKIGASGALTLIWIGVMRFLLSRYIASRTGSRSDFP